jgi:hypothetical protein
MPPWRSQSLAAADRHGASSARSMAPALVVQTPRSRHAAMISFMLDEFPLFQMANALADDWLHQKLRFYAPHEIRIEGENATSG